MQARLSRFVILSESDGTVEGMKNRQVLPLFPKISSKINSIFTRYWGVLIKGWREKGENRFFGEKKSKYIGNTHKETKIQKKRCYNTDIATVIRFIYV